MIKFFRKIRQKLLSESKFSKYLLYAFGEIILLVVGILIALAVSEWNDNHKSEIYKKEILSLILLDLEREAIDLKLFNKRVKDRVKKIILLDSLLQMEELQYDKSLDTLFGAVWGVQGYGIDKFQFDKLKAKGLDLIQVDSLRIQLIKVFEGASIFFEQLVIDDREIDRMEYLPYYLRNFKKPIYHTSAHPIDFNSLINDQIFQNLVHYRIAHFENNVIPTNEVILKEIERLRKMIENYLEK